jgi:hypothetical protein
MTLEEQVMRLPKAEKLKLMEALWSDLSRNSEEFDPPQWHREALEETERLIAEGKETFMDWEESKRMLREN